MAEAVVFTGIQAAGKTTFYNQRFSKSHVRISLDEIRTRTREKVLLERCLTEGKSLVIDNTNVTRAHRAPYIQAARAAGFRVIGYFFATDPRSAFARNRLRPGKEAIPAAGLFGTHKKLEPPDYDEGYDELYRVEIAPGGRFSVTPA